MLPALSVVVPSHHRVDLLYACLQSVVRHAPAGTEIIVVDDGSPENCVSTTAARFDTVRSLRLQFRSGFCAAANAGIAAARHPIVQLLNDDTEVCPNWAEAALQRFRYPMIAAVAPLVLQFPARAGLSPRIDSAGDCYCIGGVASKRYHNKRLCDVSLRREPVFGAGAAAAFYRRAALTAVGGFPESFGAYFEDVDLSFRLRRAGHSIVFEPDSHVYHHVSASYGANPDRDLLALQSRNEELVFWRNVPLREMWCALPLHVLILFAKAFLRAWRAELRPFLRGRLRVLEWIGEIRRHRSWLASLTGKMRATKRPGHY